jgi:ribonucleoside-diphosphate reductase alpha subunit
MSITTFDSKMFVVKRKGFEEEINFDKVHKRIKWLVTEPYNLEHINASSLTQKVIQNLYNGISTSDIDNYTANLSASLSIENHEYAVLAGRIVINNCHKNTLSSFKDKMNKLYMRKVNNVICPLISDEFYKFVEKNQSSIEQAIDYSRDYMFDFFGFRTLEKGYLLKLENDLVERPQDLYMRVSIFLHMDSSNYKSESAMKLIFETYNLMSNKYFIHATPTLFNAGTVRPALASCFLLGTHDSLAGIMKTATDCANISKWAGGIGFHFSSWRSSGALIRSTNGKSSGTIPFLRIFNDVARAFNQGGKRLGSFAAYLEPHHPDIMAFLALRRNHGDENLRTRDLFLALWISDLFMERVHMDGEWNTFDPDTCPGLTDCYGEKYKSLYLQYELEGKSSNTYRAREVWSAIFQSHKESGLPYMLYKDNVNKYNNQSNMGIIKSSNLCCEITIYSDAENYGVCCLGSICLPKCVNDTYTEEELKMDEEDRRVLNHEFPTNPVINYKKLAEISGVLCKNLNKVIDRNLYPCPEAKKSSMEGRPIGIGVQGLADVFYKLKIPFDGNMAKKINKKIFEAIYYGAISMSTKICRLEYMESIKNGETHKSKLDMAYPAYTTNGGSPLYNGNFTWELYGLSEGELSGMFDWQTVRDHVKLYGVKNSLLTALMPTASTSHINGNVECFEPLTSNMYKRKVLSGEFIIINKYMVRDLMNMGLWDDNMINYLKLSSGSVQNIQGLSNNFKEIYRTVWEVPQKSVMDMAVDRQPFIDQSQSMNLFFKDYNFDKFTSSQFYAWNNKLKTGSYYIRTQPALSPQKFTVNPLDAEKLKQFNISDNKHNSDNQSIKLVDNLAVVDEDEICLLCSA